MFAEFADGQAAQRPKCFVIERVEQEPAHVVPIGIEERTVNNVAEGNVSEDAFGGNALPFGTGRQLGEPVARLFLVRAGEDFAQVGEVKMFAADRRLIRHACILTSARGAGKEMPLAGAAGWQSRTILHCWADRGKIRADVTPDSDAEVVPDVLLPALP